jgi:hypothetical protein
MVQAAEKNGRVVPEDEAIAQQVKQQQQLWGSPGALSVLGMIVFVALLFFLRMGQRQEERSPSFIALDEEGLNQISSEIERRSADRAEQATQDEQRIALDNSLMRMLTEMDRAIERLEYDRHQEVLTRAHYWLQLAEETAISQGINPKAWLQGQLRERNRQFEGIDGVYAPMTGSGDNQFHTDHLLKDRLALMYALKSVEADEELAIAHDYMPSVIMVEETLRAMKEKDYQRELLIRMSLEDRE